MATTNVPAIWKSVSEQFAELASLSAAAGEIKTKTAKGTINAYIMIISHLGNIKATVGKKDKKATETRNELEKMGVSKAKAERFITYSQAWRRYAKTEGPAAEGEELQKAMKSQNVDDIKFCFDELEVYSETDLKKLVFPKDPKPWYESAAKHLCKRYMQDMQTFGVHKAKDMMQEDVDILMLKANELIASSYKSLLKEEEGAPL